MGPAGLDHRAERGTLGLGDVRLRMPERGDILSLADRARVALTAPRVRRRIEGLMGVVMIGFGATVATSH